MGMAPGGSLLVLVVMMMVVAMIVRVTMAVMIMGARAQQMQKRAAFHP